MSWFEMYSMPKMWNMWTFMDIQFIISTQAHDSGKYLLFVIFIFCKIIFLQVTWIINIIWSILS